MARLGHGSRLLAQAAAMNRDEIEAQLGQRIDMRAVVIVEFWAMMAGALPYGWQMRADNVAEYEYEFSVVGPGAHIKCDFRVTDSWSHYAAEEMLRAKAWAAEYAARPRMDEQ